MSWPWSYEEPSTWSAALVQACTTVYNYGVELPFCVCSTSTNAISALALEGVKALEGRECAIFSVFTVILALGLALGGKGSPLVIKGKGAGSAFVRG